MPNKDEIKKALLDAAGNPESGAVADIADDLANAVVKLLNPAPAPAVDKRETPTIAPTEKR